MTLDGAGTRRPGEVDLDDLARRAVDGDRDALSALLSELQHPMYRLALRFLGDPHDVQDACQEILIRIVTRLETFEHRSKFSTWAYTVATRAAYLLADVMGVPDVEGAEILECTRATFRQRVARARKTLRYVIDNRCGLVDPANPCRCGRQVTAREQAGILRRDHLPLATPPREVQRRWVEPVARQLDDVVAIGELYRFDRFAPPATMWADLQRRFPELLTG